MPVVCHLGELVICAHSGPDADPPETGESSTQPSFTAGPVCVAQGPPGGAGGASSQCWCCVDSDQGRGRRGGGTHLPGAGRGRMARWGCARGGDRDLADPRKLLVCSAFRSSDFRTGSSLAGPCEALKLGGLPDSLSSLPLLPESDRLGRLGASTGSEALAVQLKGLIPCGDTSVPVLALGQNCCSCRLPPTQGREAAPHREK